MAWLNYPAVRIKICGLQDTPTALAAAKAGADAIGLVFVPGRRRVTPEQARDICQSLPPLISRVGVFVDTPVEEVRQIASFCGLDIIQLHGQESPDYCRQLGLRCIKAMPAQDRPSLERANAYPVSALLVDTFLPGTRGGSGQTFNWQLLEGISFKSPLILAGGLNPGNIGRAVALVRPYGVDVSSGVEVKGKKDAILIKAFIQRVREVSAGVAG